MKIRLKWFQSAQVAVSDLLSVQKWLVKICVRAHSITTWTRKRGRRSVSRQSMLGHVKKGRNHVKCSQLSTRVGGRGQNWVKFGPHSY